MASSFQTDSQTDGKAHGGAAEQLRITAKWIVAGTFASLVVMLAGTSFSNIGSLFGSPPDYVRILISIIGGGVGLAGLVRLTLDALRVLSMDLLSLPQYAYGKAASSSSTAGIGKAKASLPAILATEYEIEVFEEVRRRVTYQLAPYWPDGIDTIEQFGQLERAAEASMQIERISASFLTLIDDGKGIAARAKGALTTLPSTQTVLITRLAEGGLVVSGRGDVVRFDVEQDGTIKVHDGGSRTITREAIEWFAKATYLAAAYSRICMAFERLIRRFVANAFLIVAGFLTLIAAINPPKMPPAPDPSKIERVEVRYDAAGREIGRTTTTQTAKSAD